MVISATKTNPPAIALAAARTPRYQDGQRWCFPVGCLFLPIAHHLFKTRRRRTNLNRAEDASPAEFFASFQIRKLAKSTQREKKEGFMKKLIHSENSRALIIAVTALISLALLPQVRAVVPAPDGGYPGGNTAEGQAALLSLTTGGFNTAVGYLSLRSDVSGSHNTAVGAAALLATTGDENTATGAGALLSNF
jgi:hypothetical protein